VQGVARKRASRVRCGVGKAQSESRRKAAKYSALTIAEAKISALFGNAIKSEEGEEIGGGRVGHRHSRFRLQQNRSRIAKLQLH